MIYICYDDKGSFGDFLGCDVTTQSTPDQSRPKESPMKKRKRSSLSHLISEPVKSSTASQVHINVEENSLSNDSQSLFQTAHVGDVASLFNMYSTYQSSAAETDTSLRVLDSVNSNTILLDSSGR